MRNLKSNITKYIVRVAKNQIIENVYYTNDYYKALQTEREMIKTHGKDNVWICDVIQEILAG